MRKTSLDCVFELAKKDKRVLFIGSDLGPGVLENFKKVGFFRKNQPSSNPRTKNFSSGTKKTLVATV